MGVILVLIMDEVLRSALKKRQPKADKPKDYIRPPRSLEETLDRRRERGSGVHRVSSPWLKLLSAVGVILILIMKKGKSSAQHSRRDNQIQADWATYAADTRPRSLEEPSIGEVGCAPRK